MSKLNKLSKTEDKIEYLRKNIQDRETKDDVAIHNIFCLVSSQTLSDALLAQDDIIFSDFEEYSDIKTTLRPELNILRHDMAVAYLSIITSCRFVPFVKDGEAKKLARLHEVLIGNLGFFALNSILHKQLPTIDPKETYLINNAIEVMSTLIRPLQVLSGVVDALMSHEPLPKTDTKAEGETKCQ